MAAASVLLFLAAALAYIYSLAHATCLPRLVMFTERYIMASARAI